MVRKQVTYYKTNPQQFAPVTLAPFGDNKGVSTVEFALILPLLSLLIVAIFQFGLLFNNYLAITHAAREGARQAAVGQFDAQKIKASAYPANPDVYLEYPEGSGHGLPVAVVVKSSYRLELPFLGGTDLMLSSRAVMRQEQ